LLLDDWRVRQSCPYLLRTARHPFPISAPFAARVAPQRNRLFQFIPAERSQNFAAAGLHGAKSFISIADAVEVIATKRNNAGQVFFIFDRSFTGTVALVID
jgi:hypothetical protein